MSEKELLDDLSDSEVMFLTIVGEARGEPVEGQIAVANTIMNRSKNRKQSIKQVCLAPKQFSCWNEDDPNRKILMKLADKIAEGYYNDPEYQQIWWVVSGVLGNKLADNIDGRDHYMTEALYNSRDKPYWADHPTSVPIVIGHHIFLNV